MEEAAFLLEVAHRVPDGRGRDPEPKLVGKAARSGRLSRLHVDLDDGFENTSFALVKPGE